METAFPVVSLLRSLQLIKVGEPGKTRLQLGRLFPANDSLFQPIMLHSERWFRLGKSGGNKAAPSAR
ncbi:MAG: hypothetical protein CMP30_01985 [Roseibacillus sp.]|nr:hypothetical protein [Roseibacillus sp.]